MSNYTNEDNVPLTDEEEKALLEKIKNLKQYSLPDAEIQILENLITYLETNFDFKEGD